MITTMLPQGVYEAGLCTCISAALPAPSLALAIRYLPRIMILMFDASRLHACHARSRPLLTFKTILHISFGTSSSMTKALLIFAQ